MAIKRIFEKNNTKARTCLECNAPIKTNMLKNNKAYTCPQCGLVHFVEIFNAGSGVVLTRDETEEAKQHHKATPEEERIAELEEQLEIARKEAKEWEAAAEGLARIVERYEEKEGKGE